MQEGSRRPLLTFASARDEAAYLLFVANNARAHSARVRVVTALVWAVSLAQFVPNFWRSDCARFGALSSKAGRRRPVLAMQWLESLVGCCFVACGSLAAEAPAKRTEYSAALCRKPVHLLRFALVTAAYAVVVFDQLQVALHLFQAKQASIRCADVAATSK